MFCISPIVRCRAEIREAVYLPFDLVFRRIGLRIGKVC